MLELQHRWHRIQFRHCVQLCPERPVDRPYLVHPTGSGSMMKHREICRLIGLGRKEFGRPSHIIGIEQILVVQLIACIFLSFGNHVIPKGSQEQAQRRQTLLAINDQEVLWPHGTVVRTRRKYQRPDEMRGVRGSPTRLSNLDDVVPQLINLVVPPRVQTLEHRDLVLLLSLENRLEVCLLGFHSPCLSLALPTWRAMSTTRARPSSQVGAPIGDGSPPRPPQPRGMGARPRQSEPRSRAPQTAHPTN